MTEQLTREQVMAMKPCQKNNIYMHMKLMGNKAWKYRQGPKIGWYICVTFSPDKPNKRNTEVVEISFDELDYHQMVISDVPDYFGSISAAWEVLSRFPVSTMERIEVIEGRTTVHITLWPSADTENKYSATASANTFELAVSRAALLAVMGL